MAKPQDMHFFAWNDMVGSFHNESDRGAAVLAGGFVDNYLGVYLRSLVVDAKIADDLFQSLGPLSSFSQRIALARAFGLISKVAYEDLTLIRKIRNQFAHHPLDATFASPEISKLAAKLSEYNTSAEAADSDLGKQARYAYLFSCGQACGGMYMRMERRKKGKE